MYAGMPNGWTKGKQKSHLPCTGEKKWNSSPEPEKIGSGEFCLPVDCRPFRWDGTRLLLELEHGLETASSSARRCRSTAPKPPEMRGWYRSWSDEGASRDTGHPAGSTVPARSGRLGILWETPCSSPAFPFLPAHLSARSSCNHSIPDKAHPGASSAPLKGSCPAPGRTEPGQARGLGGRPGLRAEWDSSRAAPREPGASLLAARSGPLTAPGQAAQPRRRPGEAGSLPRSRHRSPSRGDRGPARLSGAAAGGIGEKTASTHRAAAAATTAPHGAGAGAATSAPRPPARSRPPLPAGPSSPAALRLSWRARGRAALGGRAGPRSVSGGSGGTTGSGRVTSAPRPRPPPAPEGQVSSGNMAAAAGAAAVAAAPVCVLVLGMAGSGKTTFVQVRGCGSREGARGVAGCPRLPPAAPVPVPSGAPCAQRGWRFPVSPQRLAAHLHGQRCPPYVINLDPAVHSLPFPANIGKCCARRDGGPGPEERPGVRQEGAGPSTETQPGRGECFPCVPQERLRERIEAGLLVFP